MNITASEMRRICPSYPPERIDDDVRVFNTWAHTFGITNPLRVVHFIAQVAHESGGFRYVEELASGEQNSPYSLPAPITLFKHIHKPFGEIHCGRSVFHRYIFYAAATGQRALKAAVFPGPFGQFDQRGGQISIAEHGSCHRHQHPPRL